MRTALSTGDANRDIAAAVTLLTSDEAAYATSQDLTVAGGYGLGG